MYLFAKQEQLQLTVLLLYLQNIQNLTQKQHKVLWLDLPKKLFKLTLNEQKTPKELVQEGVLQSIVATNSTPPISPKYPNFNTQNINCSSQI